MNVKDEASSAREDATGRSYMTSSAEHWDKIFNHTDDSRLGWHEKEATTTLRLIGKIPRWQSSRVFLSGAGTSVLIEDLLSKGARLVLNDISSAALKKVRERLEGRSDRLEWLCQDIAQPIHSSVPPVDIWVDRAVLHFLTDEEDIKGYFANLQALLRVGGHAVFAEFSENGAPKCAGLTLHRYSLEELSERLGPSFGLIAHFEHTYFNPNGDPRPYIYALYRRRDESV